VSARADRFGGHSFDSLNGMNIEQPSVSAISRSRLETLFDGVFAIAMTILVLELKIPELVDRRSTQELGRALAHHAPTFVSYLLTFGMLGLFWYRHNLQYQHFRVITRSMLVLHFVKLAAAAFFPFCAALLGRYPTNGLSLLVYISCILVYAWASFANWVVAWRSGSLGSEIAPAEFLRSRKRLFRWCLIMSALFAIYLSTVLAN
jgi:uncharacterized membrane protein